MGVNNDLLSGALRLRSAGLATIPIKPDGSKQPALISWKDYGQRLPTESELRTWFGNGKPQGIALIGGKVSQNLEILDFDAPELIQEWREIVEEAAPGLLGRLPQVETPTGGLHVFYRCAEIAGNKKLAEREVEVLAETKGARQREGRWLKIETTIETRGEGGYVITAGSPTACHPLGKPYRLINGDLKAIPTISEQEREILLDCAKSFNEYIKQAPESNKEQAESQHSGLRPGDDFNQRGDVRVLLEKHGWKYLRKGPRGELWQRPGGDHTSATLFADNSLYVFSSNAHPFNHGRVYEPFSIYGLLEHEGSWKAASKALAAQGYGDKKSEKKPTNKKTIDVGSLQFEATGKGVYVVTADGEQKAICSALWIEASTRDENGESWGKLLRFLDPDGREHTWAMPCSLLSGDRAGWESILRDRGVSVYQPQLLKIYLDTRIEQRALCRWKIGWYKKSFVLPDECIGAPDGETIYYQSAEGGNYLLRTSGTLEQWRENVGRYAIGNSRLAFAVSAGFAAVFLEMLGAEGGGFHFRGTTSEGKSTVLYAAGSVWGGGSDKGFLRRWRATINGLESVGEAHNDALLCLDELAEVDPREAGEVAYMLANGQGKIRQQKTITLRRAPEWRTLFLSSGEISLADHLASIGKRLRGGMGVRLADLPADAGAGYGLFEELHGFESPKAFADAVAANSKIFYGTAIREFLRQLIQQNDSEIRDKWLIFRKEFQKANCPPKARPEVGRVCDRFALTAFAGEAASSAGITTWEKGEATKAAATMFKAWLTGRGTSESADEMEMIGQVRFFLEQHGASRFLRLDARPSTASGSEQGAEDRIILNRAGYAEADGEDGGLIYYVLPEVFRRELCKGYDPGAVLKALQARGYLHTNDGLRYQKRTPEGKQKFYAVSGILRD